MSAYPIKSPRKLIEVALPLDAINNESSQRKLKAPKGWPSTFHKWWAQRPLAAARAVIFAQLVNDPSWKWEMEHVGEIPPSHLRASWAKSRYRLFAIIEELITWENSNNHSVLAKASEAIRSSWIEVCEINKSHPQAAELFDPENIPSLSDPFAGSGVIPLEAQRLGLNALASDLNPVAVLINKAMLEIPRRFQNRPSVAPATGGGKQRMWENSWINAAGLAEDVRYYGEWLRSEAWKKIGYIYPDITVTAEMAHERPDLKPLIGNTLKPIAWIWARTVRSPNPAFASVHVPLATTFILSSKEGRQAHATPIVEHDSFHFKVACGTPPSEAKTGTSAGSRAGFRCILSGAPISFDYIQNEGSEGRMGQVLMAVVVEGGRGRVYLPPTKEIQAAAYVAKAQWRPEGFVPARLTGGTCVPYGLKEWGDLFTTRQLVSLTTFCDLIGGAKARVREDAIASGMNDDQIALDAGGVGATAYAEAIAVYLACVVDRMIYYGSSLSTWLPKDSALRDCMPRQGLAMTWDFAEGNPFGKSSGDINTCTNAVCNYLDVAAPNAPASVLQQDARKIDSGGLKTFFSIDPPYYNNIAYADLSDFFYVWLRRSLRSIYPNLFATIEVPKLEELVATTHRHGGREKAERFFLDGMTEVMRALAEKAHPAAPITIYYAFKQSDTDNAGTSSTGWLTFLEAVQRAGLSITGTWPMRTERAGRPVAFETNALASCIVLVCRPKPKDAPASSRRAFIRELNQVLPLALDEITKGSGEDRAPVAPVDLSQAIIGPGMAVFSKYSAVLEADGSPMSVRTALQLINRFLAEDDFDADTQWCLRWFEQHGWAEGGFGEADVLARSKSISVGGLAEAGVIISGGGKVALRKWADYPSDWDPSADTRLPVWETLHQLIRALKQDGENGAGKLLGAVKAQSESTRQLAYRLYTLCERQGWAEDARAYNELITSWSGIESAAGAVPEGQGELFQ